MNDLFEKQESTAVVPARQADASGPLAEISKQMEFAVQAGNVEVLERLITLRNQETARVAKLDFDMQFAKMQAEYPPVYKTKPVVNESGKVVYKYATLDDLYAKFRPLLVKYGFSYHWEEEVLADQNKKRIYCIVGGYGHERRGYVEFPIMPASKMTNSLQQVGVSTSYGQRYSFMNALGIILQNEDTDGLESTALQDKLAPYLQNIKASSTIEQLKAAHKEAWRAFATDMQAKAFVLTAYEGKANELNRKATNGTTVG